MTLRRNLITLLIWICIVAIFTIHVIFTRHKNQQPQRVMMARSSENEQRNNEADLTNERGVIESLRTFFDFPYGQHSSTTKKSTLIHISKLPQKTTEKEENCSSLDDSQKLKGDLEELTKKYRDMEAKLKITEALTSTLRQKIKARVGNSYPKFDPDVPWVFAITPTHTRYTQKADLVRLSQTLLLVTNLHWIIVEDTTEPTDLVDNLLKESGLSFTHLNIRTPPDLQRKKGEKYNKHHRGVPQRNLGLKWIRENVKVEKTPGAVYFMDDDNTYHRRIFDEMRWTRHVSVWPVALTGGAKWAGPIVAAGKVVQFRTNWAPDRSFPVDMAAFAVNIEYLITEKANVKFDKSAKRGYLEPTFLEQLTTVDALEPLADNCTKILVWHTRTEVPKVSIRGEKELVKTENKDEIPQLEV